MGTHERKEREKEQRRDAIVRAATEVFFKKGLQSATMDEIADAAELSKGTLYLYFKSKEDLYLSVTNDGFDILSEMFRETIVASESTIDALEKLGDRYFEFFTKHRKYFRMFQFFQNTSLHKQVSHEMMEACHSHNQQTWQVVIGLLEKGIAEGVLRNDLTSADMAVILWSSTNAIMLQIDYQRDQWKSSLGIDLEKLLQKANMLLLETILSDAERAKRTKIIDRAS
jgi:AcrR family transcriptional regulator